MIVQFAGCRVDVDDEHRLVRTTFDDGAELVAAPQLDPESIARARALGYTGSDEDAVWAMTRDHDLLHTVLADAHGLPNSPTLHAVAHGHDVHPLQADIEERSILLIQRLLNVGVAGVLPTTEACT